MIPVECFVARSSMREEWLQARSMGVTATQVARAATSAGFKQVIQDLEMHAEVTPNDVMLWGNLREPYIAQVVKERFGIMPNDWLISRPGLDSWMMATPDGLSQDHKLIAEIKTSARSLEKIPIAYMRQMQWQLWVTGAERCLFAWEQRLDAPDGFAPGFDVSTQWVERDEEMISELVRVAQDVQEYQVNMSLDVGLYGIEE